MVRSEATLLAYEQKDGISMLYNVDAAPFRKLLYGNFGELWPSINGDLGYSQKAWLTKVVDGRPALTKR